MDQEKIKTSGLGKCYTFELSPLDDAQQDELNRLMRKPGDPPYDPTAKWLDPPKSPPVKRNESPATKPATE